jgi:hypothetical protein
MPPREPRLTGRLAEIRAEVERINAATPPGRPGLLPGADADPEDEAGDEDSGL